MEYLGHGPDLFNTEQHLTLHCPSSKPTNLVPSFLHNFIFIEQVNYDFIYSSYVLIDFFIL